MLKCMSAFHWVEGCSTCSNSYCNSAKGFNPFSIITYILTSPICWVIHRASDKTRIRDSRSTLKDSPHTSVPGTRESVLLPQCRAMAGLPYAGPSWFQLAPTAPPQGMVRPSSFGLCHLPTLFSIVNRWNKFSPGWVRFVQDGSW